jgi:ankyrin repeat protein
MQMPLYDAAEYNQLDIVKLLLSYPIVRDDMYHLSMVLEVAAKANNIEIVQYLVREIPYTSEDFTDALPEVAHLGNYEMIKLLINAGAVITDTALLQAVYSENIDTLKYLLSFPIQSIPLGVIRNTLGLRKYDELKILLSDDRTILPVKNEALYLLDNHLYDELDKLLIPYLPDIAILYEIRVKW